MHMLGSIYSNLHKQKPIFLKGLICQPFSFGEKAEYAWEGQDEHEALHNLIYHQHHETLRMIRVLRFGTGNVLLIIKPNRLRYWLRSTAIRDADETLADLYLKSK